MARKAGNIVLGRFDRPIFKSVKAGELGWRLKKIGTRSADIEIEINIAKLGPIITKAMESQSGVTKLQSGGFTIYASNRIETGEGAEP